MRTKSWCLKIKKEDPQSYYLFIFVLGNCFPFYFLLLNFSLTNGNVSFSEWSSITGILLLYTILEKNNKSSRITDVLKSGWLQQKKYNFHILIIVFAFQIQAFFYEKKLIGNTFLLQLIFVNLEKLLYSTFFAFFLMNLSLCYPVYFPVFIYLLRTSDC